MNTRTGFTLIELIIVIVILGILAVVAAPRFIDMSSDANAASLSGLKANIESANRLIYSKALIQQQADLESGTVTINENVQVSTRYGYLTFDPDSPGTDAETWTKVLNFEICHHQQSDASCNNGNFSWRSDIDSDHIQFYHRSIGANPSQGQGDGNEPLCYLQYNWAPAANTKPSITLQTSEC